MLKIIIKDLDNGSKSKPVDIDWLLFGEEDLEFDNGDTLPLNDFKFFRKEYEICPIELQNDERIATQQSMPQGTEAGIQNTPTE